MTVPTPSLEIAGPLRDAIGGAAQLAALLAPYADGRAIFTRRPVPADAPMPLAIVNPPASISDADALNSSRPIVVRDIAFYGKKGPAGSAGDHTRAVEAAGYLARALFHRKNFSVRIEGFSVIEIIVAGPFPAPADDEGTIGRMVSLTITLEERLP